MVQCVDCGKEVSIVFNQTGDDLCWLCSSRRKAHNLTPEEIAEEQEYSDRRAWQRFPVQIHMKFFYGQSEKSKIIFPGTTVNLSQGGLCIEWTPCETCSGYTPGSIDDNCIFARYDVRLADSEKLYLSLFLSEDDVINLSAKAVFVIKREDKSEFIGVRFVEQDEFTLKRIQEIIEAVVA